MATPTREMKRDSKIELDRKDIAIINELILDSSQSATEISKKTGISKQVLGYRIRDILKKGVGRCSSLIDLGTIGFQLYDILIKYRTIPDEKELFDFLDKKELVVSYASCAGDKDLLIRIWARDLQELDQIIGHIDNRFNGFIKEKKTLFVQNTRLFQTGRDATMRRDSTPAEKKAGPDSVDRKILRMIAENPRTPLQEIAKKTKLSPNGAGNRIRTLRSRKLLTGNTLFLDHRALGKTKSEILLKKKNANQERVKALENALKKNPKITDVREYIGEWDLGIELMGQDAEEVRDVLMEIMNSFSDVIEDHTSIEIIKERKHNYYPIKDGEE